jgi:uncharacterized protein (DUF1800 family)
MKIDRRTFHGIAASALAAAWTRPLLAAAPPGDIALNRLTFGATAASRADLSDLGLAAWLDRQLALPPEDAALAERLAAATLHIEYEGGMNESGASWAALSEDRPYRWLNGGGAALADLTDWDKAMDWEERVRPAREVIAASLIRAVHAEAQLREVMTQFWHNHFNVNSGKDAGTSAYFADYDRTLRAHALGNFGTLLRLVAQAPAMLVYLNNEASRASPANENYARELLELHTLGASNYFNDLYDDWQAVPGGAEGLAAGYIDQDVYEVARAFTGWTIGDGRWLTEGDYAPRTGQFLYVDAWHDPYQKRVLGRSFPPNQGPMEDGLQVLDLLARHPGTARFLARKLIIRLVTETPDEGFVGRIGEVFLAAADAPDQIAQVIRAIVLSPEFGATPPGKIRRPFEFLAALYRANGTAITAPSLDFTWHLSQAGWFQHECRPPTGFSDVSAEWTSDVALNGLVNLALYANEDWFGAGQMPAPPEGSWGAVAGAQFAAIRGRPAGEGELGAHLAAIGLDAGWDMPADPAERGAGLRSLQAFAVLHPAFLLR